MSKKEFNPSKCIGFPIEPTVAKVTSKDSILYALGVGYSKDPMN